MADWRSDPGWRLVEDDGRENPPAKPTAAAELSQPPLWASEYVDGRPVLTWFRELPLGRRVRDELIKKAARRTGAVDESRRTE